MNFNFDIDPDLSDKITTLAVYHFCFQDIFPHSTQQAGAHYMLFKSFAIFWNMHIM